jgi:hypothetical protein
LGIAALTPTYGAWILREHRPHPNLLPEGEKGPMKTPPGGGVWFCSMEAWPYLAWSTIQVTAALTCASVNAGLPPFAGMKLPSGPW